MLNLFCNIPEVRGLLLTEYPRGAELATSCSGPFYHHVVVPQKVLPFMKVKSALTPISSYLFVIIFARNITLFYLSESN